MERLQAAESPPDGGELGALERPPDRVPGSTLPRTSARSRRLLGRNHLNDYEQLCDEHGERLTEEELMTKAAEESIAASDAHARATLAADDRAASAAEDREHPASEDTTHPNFDEHASSKRASPSRHG